MENASLLMTNTTGPEPYFAGFFCETTEGL